MGLRRRKTVGMAVGMAAVVAGVGGLAGVGAVALGSVTAGAATPSPALTDVTATVTGPNLVVGFTVNTTTGTPALAAVAIPGVQFTKTGTAFTTTCSTTGSATKTNCPGAPSPVTSVWGITKTGSTQSAKSAVVLNLFAKKTTPFTGTFAAGNHLTVTLPGATLPTFNGTYPVSVATETSPGVVAEQATTTLVVTTRTAGPAGVPATVPTTLSATPNSVGYPTSTWTDAITLKTAAPTTSTRTGLISLYVPGATFPKVGADYSATTCSVTTTGTVTTDPTCAGDVTLTVPATATSGQPGTGAVVQYATGKATALTGLLGFDLNVSKVANPTGPGASPGDSLFGFNENATTFGYVTGVDSGSVTLVSSPTVSLASTNYPSFPSTAVVGQTAKFGLTLANGSDYAWPATGASLALTATGIAALSPSSVGVQCVYEGTVPSGGPAKATFTFAGTGGSLASNAVGVPLAKTHSTPMDCTLSLADGAATGTLTITAVLTDAKAKTPATAAKPFVLATAANHLAVTPVPTTGYTLDASDGGIFTYGTAQFYGSMGGKPLNQPIVGMAMTPDGKGYWEVASDGGIFSFGDAQFYGSMGGRPLNQPIVAMAATPDGKGYWEVASDGGIFSFGDAGFFGSAGSLSLVKPVVGMAATADGKGYWLVASDGGIFTYGDAGFFGSAGSLRLKAPVVAMAATADGQGYWEVGADGGIFTFGDAGFVGSAGALTLNKPVVGMLATSDGGGYWLVASDGGIFSYGDAQFYGSAGALPLVKPVVGMA